MLRKLLRSISRFLTGTRCAGCGQDLTVCPNACAEFEAFDADAYAAIK